MEKRLPLRDDKLQTVDEGDRHLGNDTSWRPVDPEVAPLRYVRWTGTLTLS